MSRTPEVEAAMRMACEGLNGEHVADTSKQTVAWTISILAAEVERLEEAHVEAMCCLAKHAREAAHQKQRAEAAEAELKRWRMLHAWGGEPEIVEEFIRGQQTRIHHTQGIEDALAQAEARVKELEAVDELTTNQAKEYLERAEAAEARVARMTEMLLAYDAERALYLRRLLWLHDCSTGTTDADGYEWGIYRVKWVNGQAAEVWQTNSDFSDLDAAMERDGYKLPASAKALEARVRELEEQDAKLRAALENELAENLRAEAAIHGTTRSKFVLPQQERLKAALAETKAPPYTEDQAMRESADHSFEKWEQTKGTT